MFALICFVLISMFLIAAVFVFRSVWKDAHSRMRQTLINMSLVFFAVAYIFVGLEILFATVLVMPDGLNFTLTSQRWNEKYWKPINSLGYRDYEHEGIDNPANNILVVVGDSFAAGHGIKNISDRFANVLSSKIGDTWTVAVIAQNGWTTVDEYKALLAYPKNPKKIILSYFINDIHHAAEACNFPLEFNIRWPHPLLQPLMNNSYCINFFYWAISRKMTAKNNYFGFLEKVYNDDQVWKRHRQELLNIINHAEKIGADIDVVLWPDLNNIAQSKEIITKVSDFLKENNIDVLDITEHFMGRPGRELIVNQFDAHPNETTHAEIAELLYEKFGPWSEAATALQH